MKTITPPRFLGIRHLLAERRWISVAACLLIAGHLVAADVDVDLSSGWQFTNGAEYPGAVGNLEMKDKALTLVSDFTNGGQYVAAYRTLEATDPIGGVVVEASGNGGRLAVTLVDATDQSFIYRLAVPGDAARTFNLSLEKPNDSYGGANDKKLHPPLKAVRLVIEKDAANLSGKTVVTKLQFQTATP